MAPPHRLAQLSINYAIFAYIVDEPLQDVRAHALAGLRAYRVVQTQRPPLEVLSRPDPRGHRIDYSVGASDVSLRYLYWALLLNEQGLAKEIALATWDPPVKRRKPPPIHLVAYALRDLILGQPAAALEQLRQLPRTAKPFERYQGEAVAALAGAHHRTVVDAIRRLASYHSTATRGEQLPEQKVFFLPAAGLARLALERDLLGRDDLPTDLDGFPHQLVLDEQPRAGAP